MAGKESLVVSVETILRDHSPDVQEIVAQLRAIIREVVPNASEAAHPIWHSINFTHPESGYFCGIFPRQKQATLVFEFGILLPDPEGVLEGTGKQTRNLYIQEGDTIPATAIRGLLLAALSLPTNRAEKLALVRAL